MQKSGNKDKAAEATALMQKMQEQSKARNFEEAEKTSEDDGRERTVSLGKPPGA